MGNFSFFYIWYTTKIIIVYLNNKYKSSFFQHEILSNPEYIFLNEYSVILLESSGLKCLNIIKIGRASCRERV